ncbi:hypothetical protein PAPYR_8169 [Paratrimastix pyriformis]|uniref:PRELI/MSF1 domain-containing protein n=1 Tax=Paratrimastix pyriformis TaxID=342808 RepID=A0ABQ8UGT4_9EUKA|nr:hypothetical protein PAPYR_8169 [Paratrimastix pyriformis]
MRPRNSLQARVAPSQFVLICHFSPLPNPRDRPALMGRSVLLTNMFATNIREGREFIHDDRIPMNERTLPHWARR